MHTENVHEYYARTTQLHRRQGARKQLATKVQESALDHPLEQSVISQSLPNNNFSSCPV